MELKYGDRVVATIRDGWFHTRTLPCTITHIAPCGLLRVMPSARTKPAQWIMKGQIVSKI